MSKNQNTEDNENLVKASQTANLLVQDIRALLHSGNPLLADIAMEILEQAVKVENRLKRLETIGHSK